MHSPHHLQTFLSAFVLGLSLCKLHFDINRCARSQCLRWTFIVQVVRTGVQAHNADVFVWCMWLQKEAAGGDPKWGIIIPIAPFGMPEYDGGERFDLRLPHVDNGWVDEDAAFGKTMARIFRWQKKEDKDAMNGKPGNALKGKTGKGKK